MHFESLYMTRFEITPIEILIETQTGELHIKKEKISYYSIREALSPLNAIKTIGLIYIITAFALSIYGSLMFIFATSMFVGILSEIGFLFSVLLAILTVINAAYGAYLSTLEETVNDKYIKLLKFLGMGMLFIFIFLSLYLLVLIYSLILIGMLTTSILALRIRPRKYLMLIVDNVQLYITGNENDLESLYKDLNKSE